MCIIVSYTADFNDIQRNLFFLKKYLFQINLFAISS